MEITLIPTYAADFGGGREIVMKHIKLIGILLVCILIAILIICMPHDVSSLFGDEAVVVVGYREVNIVNGQQSMEDADFTTYACDSSEKEEILKILENCSYRRCLDTLFSDTLEGLENNYWLYLYAQIDGTSEAEIVFNGTDRIMINSKIYKIVKGKETISSIMENIRTIVGESLSSSNDVGVKR